MKQFRKSNYYITKNGDVFNKKTNKYLKIKLHQPKKSNFKRRFISLPINGKRTTYTIARMVAECYLSDFNTKLQVNHKDGNPLNDHYSNLECVTQSENIRHAIFKGLKPIGNKTKNAKLNWYFVKEIRNRYSTESISIRKLAKEYNVSYTAIRYLLNNKTWKT